VEAGAKLYDTSALVELHAVRRVRRLSGYTTALNVVEYPPAAVLGLEIIYPSRADYELAFSLQVKLRRRGVPVPAVDLVVSAVAVNRELTLVAVDEHFRRIAEVEPRLKVVGI